MRYGVAENFSRVSDALVTLNLTHTVFRFLAIFQELTAVLMKIRVFWVLCTVN
jgi:hypothetical protein